ncbi:hypothetical protein G6O67_006598 [Ophiocordyceps sinensis]|nr:hypothetical protein G6O67_006598 [Ophiocordyceps sinensis]
MASLSFRFQWLPCDVSVDGRGRTRIDSYINNLHPMDHGGLYDVVNGFIERSLPAWDVIYQWPTTFCFQRLRAARVGPKCGTRELCEKVYECRPMNRPLNGGETERQDDEERQDGFEESERARLDSEWFEATHPVEVPDVVTASQASQRASQTPSRQPDEPHQFRLQPKDVKHSGFFNGASRIQVIVKLANIHLTPEQPTYDGGSWHIEGQLNEHICATALYYYDNDNITESRLAFRARSNVEELRSALEYEQWDYRSISRTFAIDAVPGRDTTLQDVGSILTREGRALFFPNLFQHRVEPFSLVDRSRPGHRKILALFLVDPAIPIISTANVPPQQPHWRPGGGEAEGDAISEAEARRIREELMAERSALQSKTTERLRAADFNFCEH